MARHQVEGSGSRWITVFKGFVLALVTVGVGFGSYSYWLVQETLSGVQAPPVTNSQGEVVKAPQQALPPGPRTILVLGTDARDKEEATSRTDTMLLLRVDPETKKATLISIPRDTWVQVPGQGSMKINAAHVYGQGPLAKSTVEELTGMTVNYYLTMDWRAFRQFVDAVGPVKVYIPKKIYDPIHDFRLAKGCQTLNGYEALQYVRFRHDSRGDIGRIERQQAFMKAISGQAMSFRIIPKIPRIMSIVGNNTVTDMPSGEIYALGNLLRQIPKNKIETVMIPGDLGRKRGQSVIIPAKDDILEMTRRIEAGEPATPPAPKDDGSSSGNVKQPEGDFGGGSSSEPPPTTEKRDFPAATQTTVDMDCN